MHEDCSLKGEEEKIHFLCHSSESSRSERLDASSMLQVACFCWMSVWSWMVCPWREYMTPELVWPENKRRTRRARLLLFNVASTTKQTMDMEWMWPCFACLLRPWQRLSESHSQANKPVREKHLEEEEQTRSRTEAFTLQGEKWKSYLRVFAGKRNHGTWKLQEKNEFIQLFDGFSSSFLEKLEIQIKEEKKKFLIFSFGFEMEIDWFFFEKVRFWILNNRVSI